jgi:hypothetical protein
MNPRSIATLHPSDLEAKRMGNLALVERRALYMCLEVNRSIISNTITSGICDMLEMQDFTNFFHIHH